MTLDLLNKVSDKESDREQNDNNFETLTEYEENETDLDIDINEDSMYYENWCMTFFFLNKNHINTKFGN